MNINKNLETDQAQLVPLHEHLDCGFLEHMCYIV